jgi:hypothetical protein
MVIHQLYVEGIGGPPDKTQPPLVIDTDAPLAGAVAAQLLQLIARWRAEILQGGCGIKDPQLTQTGSLDIRAPLPDGLTVEQAFRVPIAEAPEHAAMITRRVIIVK